VDADLKTLATALYVSIDDALKMHPELGRPQPEIGLCPKLSDADLLTLAVIQALLAFSSETRFLRHASVHLRQLFPYVPGQSGYNTRLRRAAPQLRAVIRLLAVERAGSTTPGSSTRPRSSAGGPGRPAVDPSAHQEPSRGRNFERCQPATFHVEHSDQAGGRSVGKRRFAALWTRSFRRESASTEHLPGGGTRQGSPRSGGSVRIGRRRPPARLSPCPVSPSPR
jgi:hypothetical protein